MNVGEELATVVVIGDKPIRPFTGFASTPIVHDPDIKERGRYLHKIPFDQLMKICGRPTYP